MHHTVPVLKPKHEMADSDLIAYAYKHKNEISDNA